MFRVAHFADLHFMNKPQVLPDIIKCSNFAVNELRVEAPDLIALAGDLVDFLASPEGIMIGSPAHMAAVDFVYGCGMIAPTIIVRGTPTHDGPGALDAMARLRTAYPIYVTERPEQIALMNNGDRTDFITLSETPSLGTYHRAIISCLPTISKGNVLAYTSGSVADTTREVQDLMRDMFQAWGVVNEQAGDEGIPTVLVGHGTVTGSELSTGQVMTGKDLEFTTGDLRLAACDVYCLGHIHKAQSWGSIHYSGSITRLNHGETEEKGFLIHEIEVGGYVSSRTIVTPARVMRTIRQEGLPGIESVEDVQEGENVRIVYTVAEADVGKVDEQAIIAAAMEKGATDVKIEKVIIPTVRVRAEGISKEQSLEAKLAKWGETTGQTIEPAVYHMLGFIGMEPETIIDELYGEKKEADYASDVIAA